MKLQTVREMKHDHGFGLIADSITTAAMLLSCTHILNTSQIGINKYAIAGKDQAPAHFYIMNGALIVASVVVGGFVVLPRIWAKQ